MLIYWNALGVYALLCVVVWVYPRAGRFNTFYVRHSRLVEGVCGWIQLVVLVKVLCSFIAHNIVSTSFYSPSIGLLFQ